MLITYLWSKVYRWKHRWKLILEAFLYSKIVKKSATDYSSGIAVHDMILTLSTGSVDKHMLSPNILHAIVYEI